MNTVKLRINHLRSLAHMMLEEADELEQVIEYQPESDEWISTKEAAEICGIDRSTLNRYALTKKVEAKRIGGLWKFPKSKVEDMSFIKAR